MIQTQLHKDMAHRRTRREAVWRFLTEHMGEWLDAHVIASPSVGGSEGLRRLRELRASLPPGFRIEKRRKRTEDGWAFTWQYRLVRVDNPSAQDCG
ncbi:hypothetical protein [Kyrpidia tusciae]|uniref:Transposase n=1 Tax=Kyrpidia tusciae (strain DSM 2912 / NBRC 15312 / T2) TaxID=562970 RepID=D5WQM5_KYRT2|nr:hypothetical protein [Kyrpidia tusciae]ADG06634.1 hypothetical protein Btus_1939 [Kyrpidia tusciae DSM 2912]